MEKHTSLSPAYALAAINNLSETNLVPPYKLIGFTDLSVDKEAYPLMYETFNECLYAPCYTIDQFYEGKKAIPLIDMELYYIRALCQNLISYKIVSDNCSSSDYDNFNPQKAWDKLNYILNKIVNEKREAFIGQQGY